MVTHLNKLNLSVARTPDSETLILGDDPVCLTVHDYYNNKTRPQEGHGVVGMPLDQRTFILWHSGAPDRHNETSLTRLTNRGVRDINRTILDQSNRNRRTRQTEHQGTATGPNAEEDRDGRETASSTNGRSFDGEGFNFQGRGTYARAATASGWNAWRNGS